MSKIKCMVCGTEYEPNPMWRHSTGICSPECRVINQRRIKSKYKHSDKGRETEMRWRDNPKRDAINKEYVKRSDYAKEASRRLARLYNVIRGSSWWKVNSLKGCVVCGTTEDIGIDHIIPRVRGGSDDFSNLQILCSKHNGEKWIK